jgi:hypothetical protein
MESVMMSDLKRLKKNSSHVKKTISTFHFLLCDIHYI